MHFSQSMASSLGLILCLKSFVTFSTIRYCHTKPTYFQTALWGKVKKENNRQAGWTKPFDGRMAERGLCFSALSHGTLMDLWLGMKAQSLRWASWELLGRDYSLIVMSHPNLEQAHLFVLPRHPIDWRKRIIAQSKSLGRAVSLLQRFSCSSICPC